MPLPPDFADESLYTEDHWYLHDLVEVDAEAGLVVATMDTTRLGHTVDAQVERPGHPKHVPGAVMVQVTATLGNLHAVYALGLRPSEGWVGFGTHIKDARFPSLGVIGPAVTCRAEAGRVRTVRGTRFVEYRFTYTQDGRTIYSSTQLAGWRRGAG
jgi:hypothetical protein